MPTENDLMGLGMAAQLSHELGNSPVTVTCTGTAQGTAATINAKSVELVAASSNTGAIFPSTAKIGTPYYLTTTSSTSAVAYVPSGHYLNGSLNGGLTIAQNKGAIMWQFKRGYWASVINA